MRPARVWLLLSLLLVLATTACGAPSADVRSGGTPPLAAGDDIEVRLGGSVVEGLAWEIESEFELVRAEVGTSYRTTFWLRNLTGEEMTVRASRRTTTPDGFSSTFKVLGCFCMIEQTLGPHEEVAFPVWIRVEPGAPRDSAYALEFVVFPIDQYERQRS